MPLIPIPGSQLLYRAEKQFHSEPAPALLLRFLLYSAPLRRPPAGDRRQPVRAFPAPPRASPHQYGCSSINPQSTRDRQSLIGECSDHVMLVHADEIDKIPAILQF